MYRVEYQVHGESQWYYSTGSNAEGQAISAAKRIAQRRDVETVRVVDPDGHVVWMS